MTRIDNALQKALAWMDSRCCPGMPPGVMTSSDFHNPDAWPGICLPATYNITNARVLVDGTTALTETDRQGIGAYLAGHQDNDGRFTMPGMADSDVWKGPDLRRTCNYITSHISNYAREALSRTEPERLQPPVFCLEYVPNGIEAWLEERDWDDPWMEGNSIVNLAAGLVELNRLDMIDELIEGLNRRQDPATGFWGRNISTDRTRLLHAFAGAMHVFHLYYLRDAPLHGAAAAVDAGLELAAGELAGPTSACLDVDIVDMLAALWPVNHRRSEIRGFLAEKLDQMLSIQNEDGGFPDEKTGIRRFDGWVGGYWEPQGMSNGFATWFRLITIAIASSVVHPEYIGRWTYRNSIGIGYFNPLRLTEV